MLQRAYGRGTCFDPKPIATAGYTLTQLSLSSLKQLRVLAPGGRITTADRNAAKGDARAAGSCVWLAQTP